MSAKRKTVNKKRASKRSGGAAIFLLIALAAALYFVYPYISDYLGQEKNPGGDSIAVGEGEYVELHIIDVGQGDSILVATSGGYMLIDAGPGSAEDDLKDYLVSYGVSELEYAVFTHPHEDHIGGADMIMTDFTVSNVILPDCEASSQTYKRMTDAIEDSGANVIVALTGSEYTLGSMTATVLAPISAKYSNTNNYSIVMKLEFGDTSFMLTGDAEVLSEEEIMAQFSADFLKCDLLKVGHHGSDTSTSLEFLRAVAPSLAAISCGAGNSYGHPHGALLSRLADASAEIFRTDEAGSIVFVSDGKKVALKGK